MTTTAELLEKAFETLKHPLNKGKFARKPHEEEEKDPSDTRRRAIKGAKWGAGIGAGLGAVEAGAVHSGLKAIGGEGLHPGAALAHVGGRAVGTAITGAAIAGGLSLLHTPKNKVHKVDYAGMVGDEAAAEFEKADAEMMDVLEKAMETTAGRIAVEQVATDLDRIAKAWGNPETHHEADSILQSWADGEDGAGPLRKALSMAWLHRARSAIAPAMNKVAVEPKKLFPSRKHKGKTAVTKDPNGQSNSQGFAPLKDGNPGGLPPKPDRGSPD